MTRKVDFEAARNAVDLAEVAKGYTALNRSNQGPCPFCGGRDRFYVHVDRQRCGCRKCGFQGDAIALVAKMEGLAMAEAARTLRVPFLQGRSQSCNQLQPAPKRSTGSWKQPEWQAKARAYVDAGERRLAISEDGRAYLALRGISRELARQYHLGFDDARFDPATKCRRPAMIIPWIDGAGNICAVRLRFCDERASKDRSARFSQLGGSQPLLFGLHALAERCPPVLIAVEGEFNALAISQVTSRAEVDVVSIGSQQGRAPLESLILIAQARVYASVLVWLDEECRAVPFLERIPGSTSIPSRANLDANALLCEQGELALYNFIAEQMPSRVKVWSPHDGIPLHLRQRGVLHWNPKVEAAWAWFDWVNLYSRDYSGPNLKSVDQAIRFVKEKWAELCP